MGTALPIASGGTGLNSVGASTYLLSSTGTAMTWSAPSSVTTGTATNLAGGTTGATPYQSAAGTTTFLPLGTTNYVMTAGATGPQYVAQSTLSVGSATTATTATSATSATTATNLAGGAANQVPYQTGSGATSFVAAPSTAGYVLGWTGSAIDWVAAPAATTASNLTGGGAYTVVYQSSTGVTAYLTNGTTGQVLTANTSGAPTWSTINALPSQTGNAGKYLYTDGSTASWENTGASAGGVIWENSTTISSNYTLTTSKNGLSVGPITIASGAVVTVPTGQRWVVL